MRLTVRDSVRYVRVNKTGTAAAATTTAGDSYSLSNMVGLRGSGTTGAGATVAAETATQKRVNTWHRPK